MGVSFRALGGGGGGAAWRQFGNFVVTAPVGVIDFTGLAGAADILVSTINLVKDISESTELQVSTDNGASFIAGLNYSGVAQNGAVTLDSKVAMHTTNSALARSGSAIIYGANLTGNVKNIMRLNGATAVLLTGTLLPVNAIRIKCGGAGVSFISGSVEVMVR